MSTQSASLMNFIKEQSKANYMDIDFEVDDYQSHVNYVTWHCEFCFLMISDEPLFVTESNFL